MLWFQYLAKAYETKVIDQEKKKLLVSIPIDVILVSIF